MSTTVSIKNNTSNNIAFEATVMVMQGQHLTVRATLPATATTVVTLPNGVTAEMLAASAQVQAEQAKSSPNWSIVSVSSGGVVGGLSDYEVFRAQQAAAASATLQLGCAQRNMKLTKLRVCSTGPSAVGETYTITELHVNGVNVLPVAQQLVLPASQLAYVDFSQVLSGAWTAINEGDFLEVVTVLAGGATLTAMTVEVVGSKT